MPIEIRELIIKTEIRTTSPDSTGMHNMHEDDFTSLKMQLLESCKRMITEINRKTRYNR